MLEGFHRPSDPREALRMHTSLQGSGYIAGGTEINSRKELPYRHLISLADVDLDIIQRIGDSLFMGATVTLQQVADAEEIREGVGLAPDLPGGVSGVSTRREAPPCRRQGHKAFAGLCDDAEALFPHGQ
jgi:hypothetical protein